MTAQIENVEETQDTQEKAGSQIKLTAPLTAPRNWADRWADHISEVGDAPMCTDPTWEDLDEDKEEETDGLNATPIPRETQGVRRKLQAPASGSLLQPPPELSPTGLQHLGQGPGSCSVSCLSISPGKPALFHQFVLHWAGRGR